MHMTIIPISGVIVRRRFVLTLVGLLLPSLAKAQPLANGLTHRFDVTCSPEAPYVSQFWTTSGARRVSAIVNSEVKATAFLDVSADPLDDKSTVMGVVSVDLQPKQAQIIALPLTFANQAVRLRVVNQDTNSGRVIATLSVLR
jgi:hypothetical protein